MTNHIDKKRTGATAPRGGRGEPFGANDERKAMFWHKFPDALPPHLRALSG